MKYYIDYFLGALFALLLIAIWYFSSLAIEEVVLPKQYDFIIQLLTVVIGAFVGALAAFNFNRRINTEKELSERVDKARNTLFKLMLKKHNLVDTHYQYLSKYKDTPLNWLLMPATANMFGLEGDVELNELSFLQEKYGVEMFNLYVAVTVYEQAVNTLNERSNTHRDRLQPLLKSFVGEVGSDKQLAELIQLKHPELVDYLRVTTEHTFEMFSYAEKKLSNSIKTFEGILEKEFPNAVFLNEDTLF